MAKQVLGRGLDSLLGEMNVAYNLPEDNKNDLKEISIDQIKPNPYQPRKQFDQEKLEQLAASISENGLLQPIIVMQDDDEKYLIIAGERRYRASKIANLSDIKAIVLDVDKTKLRQLALIENIQRDDLNIIEIANSYQGLIEDYNITHDELSKIVSKSRSSISNILRLLSLTDAVKDMLEDNKISLGHAKLLVSLDEELQKTIAVTIVNQKLSVRQTEELIKKVKTDPINLLEEKKQQTQNILDYSGLQTLQDLMKKDSLDIKIDKNYFKIKINSQEDIEKIVAYFNNK
jgi:ParB family chromosome partitioning protein